MCERVAEEPDPVKAGALVMWRLAWIHPFGGGNGRTARAASYLVICAKLGLEPPGSPVLPERILQERSRYFAALRDADEAFRESSIFDVEALTELIDELLKEQLGA
jgi:Fic family protein